MTTRTAPLVDYDDAVARYEPVLGLEVHVELNTASKMFCSCSTAFGAQPNTQVCPTCLGLPGSLPVVNHAAVESAIRMGLALNCDIAPWGRFARKNYFYPDMPKDYQISQYDEPLCVNGWLDVTVPGVNGAESTTVRVGIERVHMEEDTGKLTHAGGATGRIHGADYSLVDYNRAGVPLIEIVTKPVTGTGALAPEVARAYVTELRSLMRALGVSDVRMEEGRCVVTRTSRSLRPVLLGNAHRDQERQLVAIGRARGALRDPAAGRGAGRRGSITQETRHFHGTTVRPPRSVEGDGRGLPLLPGPGFGPGRAGGRVRGIAARHPARTTGRASRTVACRVGLERIRHVERRECWRHGLGHRNHRGRGRSCRRSQVVAGRVGAGGQ